jgi:hypothetical protein
MVKKGIHMTQESYQRLLTRRMSFMRRNIVLHEVYNEIDDILALPHPQREIEFVAFAKKIHLQEKHFQPNNAA